MNAPELKWTVLDYVTEGIRSAGSLEVFLDELYREVLARSEEAQESSETATRRLDRARYRINSGVLSRVAHFLKCAGHECSALEHD